MTGLKEFVRWILPITTCYTDKPPNRWADEQVDLYLQKLEQYMKSYVTDDNLSNAVRRKTIDEMLAFLRGEQK